MTKQSAFERDFSEVIKFEGQEFVLSREHYTKEQAFHIFKKELEEWGRDTTGFSEKDLKEDWVRYYRGEIDGEVGNSWWLYQEGKPKAKKVWTVNLYDYQKL